MSDGAKFDMSPLATEAEMAAWAEIGRADQKALEIYWLAHHAVRSCWRECDCPFGDAFPVARQRWLDMFRINVKARDQRRQKELADAEAEAPDKKGQWWMRY